MRLYTQVPHPAPPIESYHKSDYTSLYNMSLLCVLTLSYPKKRPRDKQA